MRTLSLKVRALELIHYYSVGGALDDRVVPVLKSHARLHVVLAEGVDLLFVLSHELVDGVGVLSDEFSKSHDGVSHEGSDFSLVSRLDVGNEIGESLDKGVDGFLVLGVDLVNIFVGNFLGELVFHNFVVVLLDSIAHLAVVLAEGLDGFLVLSNELLDGFRVLSDEFH